MSFINSLKPSTLYKETAVIRKLERGDLTSVYDYLVQRGTPNAKTRDHYTLLMAATLHRHIEFVDGLLKLGADPNIPANDGFTALMRAILNDNLAIARILLKHGAKPDQQDDNGETPLSIAQDSNNTRMSSLIIKYSQ